MEERWWPWIFLLGAVAGYALFMRYHPLRTTFSIAFRFVRNNLTIVAGLALLFAADVIWRSWQQKGLGGENVLTLSLGVWADLLDWVPIATEDLRSVFWYCVPLDAAFFLGTPLAVLTCWYWMPRLWKACDGRRRLIAASVFAVYALSFWWWWHRCSMALWAGAGAVPGWPPLQQALRLTGEAVFAVILVCFVQLVLFLGAYRSHGSGDSRCRLKEAVDWGLKCFPRTLLVPALVLAAGGINWLAEAHLDPRTAPAWQSVKLAAILLTAALPICVLLLQDLQFIETIWASIRFLVRTGWLFAWFVFLCLTHFFLLRLLESYLLTSVLEQEFSVIAWYLVAATLRAALVMGFVNAFCLYFCVDITKRRKATGRRGKGLGLAILKARTHADSPSNRRLAGS